MRGQVNAVGKLHGLDVQAQRVDGDEPSERARLIPMSASSARARSPVKRSAKESGINLPGTKKPRYDIPTKQTFQRLATAGGKGHKTSLPPTKRFTTCSCNGRSSRYPIDLVANRMASEIDSSSYDILAIEAMKYRTW